MYEESYINIWYTMYVEEIPNKDKIGSGFFTLIIIDVLNRIAFVRKKCILTGKTF